MEAAPLAALQRSSALAGFAHIFPPEAPKPTLEGLTEQWAGVLADRSQRVIVTTAHDVPIGVVVAGPDPVDPGVGHVARLYVAPSRWGRGTGSSLLDGGVGELRRQGFAEATLWVLERNERARSWYERRGWRPTGERKPVWAPGGIDDVGYRIDLRS